MREGLEGTKSTNQNTGYQMAKNLRAKIPNEDTLTVFDVNDASTKRLVEETGAKIHVATSAKEVAEMSVCALDPPYFLVLLMNICSIDDLSWGGLMDLPRLIYTKIIANPLIPAPHFFTTHRILYYGC